MIMSLSLPLAFTKKMNRLPNKNCMKAIVLNKIIFSKFFILVFYVHIFDYKNHLNAKIFT